MSRLEAIRWKQKYSDDIMAIIGIDMATTLFYQTWTNKKILRTLKLAKKLKLYKIPNLYPLSTRCLTKNEIHQQKLLMNRNTFNICYINEGKKVLQNSKFVNSNGNIKCPILLFSSNGKQIDKYWVRNQQEFAKIMNAKLISFDCNYHYIHYYKSNDMVKKILKFVDKII